MPTCIFFAGHPLNFMVPSNQSLRVFSSTAGKYIRPGFQGGISTTGRYTKRLRVFSSTAGKYIRPGFQGGISTTGRYTKGCGCSLVQLGNISGLDFREALVPLGDIIGCVRKAQHHWLMLQGL